ncbi:glycosyltransferase family 2 protein [Agromyces sp. MMS24-JH15]|uniref:glycosyltransferase family 2 protein n=1 Tax=Agromyces sp. MMS24-JH15 TaxID=3243765 RepID=UPI0037488004
MLPRVTAILVVQRGGDRLQRSLDAVLAQERRPDSLVVVLLEPDAAATEQVRAAAPDHAIELQSRMPFGEAVRAAERSLEPPDDDADLLWLLPADAAPAPDALARLVAVLETGRSVAIAAGKLVAWDDPRRILHLGRSVTKYGRTVDLVHGELDQGQHDDLSDVLGVDAAGLLVRRVAWRALEGFDPALPSADDALDLSIRARLAGHRVSVVPEARIAFAQTGIAGPAVGGASALRRRHRVERAAQLHRRLAYAPAVTVPLHWLALLPLALVRSVWLLLVKSPGRITGEFRAALGVMLRPHRVAASRRALKRAKAVGWSALAPLRVPPDEVGRRRRLEAEARRARARGRSDDLQFLGTGGGWVLLASVVASVALLSWMLTAGGLAGGALLPLTDDVGSLWRNAAYGFRDVGAGFVGAADPFSGVLAVLGSLAFWSPSWAMVGLWLVAVPAAALGAWFAASRLTDRGALRALAAIAWACSPPFITALADGRPQAVVAHVLLGWLAFAALGAARSWAAAATAGLLLAAVVAAAPSLAPALVVGWVLAIAVSGRAAPRYLLLPLPAVVLAGPLVWAQAVAANPWGLAADPGAQVAGDVSGWWWLALGFPGGSTGGWAEVASSLDAGIAPEWIATALLAPLVLAAAAAVAAPRVRRGILAVACAVLGFATAVAASHLAVATSGADSIPVWTGGGQSLMWFGLVVAAVVALDALPRASAWLAALAAVAAIAAVAPAAVALALGTGEVRVAGERTMPAFVVAEAEADPRVATLTIAPLAGGGIAAGLEHGTGDTLDAQSTFAATGTSLTEDERELAHIAGNLASRSGADADAAITEFGATFVLLAAAPDDPAAEATEDRAIAALDANASLTPIGDTAFGRLYRFTAAVGPQPPTAIPPGAGGTLGTWITIVQLVVIGAALLLSIPTGGGRETDRRPPREPRASRASRRGGSAGSPPPAAAAAEAEAATVDGESVEPEAAAAEAPDVATVHDAPDVPPELEPDPDPALEPEPEPEPDPEPDAADDADIEPDTDIAPDAAPHHDPAPEPATDGGDRR